tara:strand:+ start:195 stop:407 length:213 start_codon:yes stop_codon:yes gene_type:complete
MTQETERTAIEFSEDGKVEQIIVDPAGMGDVQAGIEFIYHMREHILDVGVATAYLFGCYALYLWLKKVIK